MNHPIRAAALCALAVIVSLPAAAWGPRTQYAIVSNAVQLISKDSNIPLVRLQKDLLNGAQLSMEMIGSLYPDMVRGPVTAIESELGLLRAVESGRVDPYFAFRLGVLGKLVAEATSPMGNADPTYRNLYYADVEKSIQRAPLQNQPRTLVEPAAYFSRVMAEANYHNDMLIKEYQDGIGFQGVAGAILSDDASRSVNAVADVWHTILTGRAVAGNVSERQVQRYVVDAMAFYINRGSSEEIDTVSARLGGLVGQTPDMRIQIGDMLSEAELYARAMTEYQAVLAVAPDRRDVVEKIARYYVSRGQRALEDERLEAALADFETAVQADPLHPTAESLRIQAVELIAARDARLAKNREDLEAGEKFQGMAEEEALSGRYAEAIALLHQAVNRYNEVTEEFPNEFQLATRGAKNALYRVQEFKREIMANAQSFSGSGSALDARGLARDGAKELEKGAIQALLRNAYREEMKNLEAEMASALAIP